jgi:signal transduction histidine kinase
MGFLSLIGTSIVARLRSVFMLFVCSLLAIAFIYSYLLFEIKKIEKEVIDSAIPQLVRAHFLESEFRELLILLGQYRSLDELADIVKFKFSIESELQVIRNALIETGLTSRHENVEAAMAAFERLELVVQTREDLSRLLIAARSNLYKIRDDLAYLKEQMHDVLHPNLLDLSVELDGYLFDTDSPLDVGDKQTVRGLVQVSAILSLLQTEASTAFEQAVNLTFSPGSNDNKDALTQLQFTLHRMAEKLVYLSDKSRKAELAALTQRLYELSFSSGGISENLEIHQQSADRYTLAEESESQVIAELSSWIESEVESTVAYIEKSSVGFRKAINLVLISTLGIGILVVATALYLNRTILERQIHERMSSLTHSVLAIAAQDTAHEVTVNGTDEIGAIAHSLEVFRKNILELQRSNNELKQFAYAASHDLKSPLSAISSLADWIIEDSLDDLSDESRENLFLLRRRVDRLGALQSALLEYSQAGMGLIHKEVLNFDIMIAEIGELLDPEGKYKVASSSLLENVETHRMPLYQILTNLVDNAIKHHDREGGNINISATLHSGWLRISVSDDGPGIEKRFQKEIFQLFRRLQSQDQVEGSGLGLSMVRKLIDRFDAEIEVVSDPEVRRGTTFTFTWPCNRVGHRADKSS